MESASRTAPPVASGVAAAAFLAGGIGCFAMGLFTSLAQASPSLSKSLNWWNPTGPLMGKSNMATLIFFVSWLILHLAWRKRPIRVYPAYLAGLILILLGLLGTFPPFFEALGH